MGNMFVEQLYTGCLSEAAYFIESEGEAAVVDPIRDIRGYLELAKKRNAVIKYIFETHFHADFISGHLELAAETGAKIVYGPQTSANFPVYLAKDGEEFKLGKLTIQAIHTPGHTIESTCYLLNNETGKPYYLFTGDTLFVNEVGRPDLFSGNLSKEALAGYLYDSLQNKIKTLPDEVIIYPAHGPGSACGKNLGPSTFSTIGEQRETNYALLINNKDEFIQKVTEGLTTPPQYFPVNAKINQDGYAALNEILKRSLQPLSVLAFKQMIKQDAVILDTRLPEIFVESFVPGAINIALDGRFAEWVGILVPYQKPVILVTDIGKEEEAIIRMARVGFDNVVGYLKEGMQSWLEAGEKRDMIITVDPDELAMDIPFDQNLVVIDVRKPAEYEDSHIKGAINIPLSAMTDPIVFSDLEENYNLYIHCQSGYRSTIACSILKREGIHNLRNVAGGFDKLTQATKVVIVRETSILN
jgi:hydroxyacylglutathione hydrolase